MSDLPTYLAQAVAATLYAALLEFGVTRRRYEPGLTWLTVVVGTAMTGLIVAARLALAPVPPLAGAALAWWAWWLIAWSFVASGAPIIAWQLALRRGAHR